MPDTRRGVHGPGGRATAIAWIRYADNTTTGKLRRPLVFVEGIDFDKYRNATGFAGPNRYISQTGPIPLSDFEGPVTHLGGYRNGAAGWNEMVDYNNEYKSLEKFPVLRQQLQAPASSTFPNGGPGGDYDVVYLDFSDGASLIQDNAMVLAELLEWINQPANRAPGAEETLVIGTSMGGQVARFALAWMEQQGLCHNSKLYVSFDSPHRGANVPVGIQHLFDRLQGVWIGSGSAEDVVQNKLMREATQQMVVFHFNHDARWRRDEWQSWQASPGSYPSLLRRVAVANGSGQAATQPGTYPGMQMLHTRNGFFNFGTVVVGENYAYAVPGAQSRGHNNVVFRYHKAFSAFNNWRYTYADWRWAPYDTAPGSTSRVAADAQEQNSYVMKADYNTNTFMPTISALDVKVAGSYNSPDFTYDVQQNIDPSRPSRALYAFDAYFAAGNVNEPHVQITNAQGSTQGNPSFFTNNSNWIQNELRESAHLMPAVLTGVYNYGSPYRHLLPSVQVNGGGELYFNNGNLPVNGGTPATRGNPPQGNFEAYTSNCATVVQVNNGGIVAVGVSAAHTASLQMAANSLLDLRAGGRLDVNTGSVLRIVAGATLVVRQGATLNVYGQVVVEAGAYLCVENQSSIVVIGAGTYTVSPLANFTANPALNLGALACDQPPVSPLQVSITSLTYTAQGQCYSPSGGGNYAQWTAAATGGNGAYTYAWYLDPTASGNSYAGPYSNGTTYGVCMSNYSFYVRAKVVVTSGTQQAFAEYYASPQYRTALYPNPADKSVDIANADAVAESTAAAPGSSRAPMQVTVHNGQGRVVFTSAHTTTPMLRLDTQSWPAGLYQVTVQHGKTITRRQLSVQH